MGLVGRNSGYAFQRNVLEKEAAQAHACPKWALHAPAASHHHHSASLYKFFQPLGPVRPLSNSFILEAFGYGFNNLKRRDINDIQAQEPRYLRQLEQRRILKKISELHIHSRN